MRVRPEWTPAGKVETPQMGGRLVSLVPGLPVETGYGYFMSSICASPLVMLPMWRHLDPLIPLVSAFCITVGHSRYGPVVMVHM